MPVLAIVLWSKDLSLADWIVKEDTGEKLKDFGAEENLDEKEEEEDAKENFDEKEKGVSQLSVACQ